MAGEQEFDVAGAVSQISEGLGFDEPDGGEGGGEGGAGEGDSPQLEGSGEGKSEEGSGGEGGEGGGEKPADGEKQGSEKPAEGTPSGDAATPPRTWRPEAAAVWAQIPSAAQAEILKREQDIFKGIETYREAAEFGAPLKQVMDPYLPVLQQYGIKPESQVADMMQAHYTLAFGTQQQKAALIQQVIKDYGVDVAGLNFQADPNKSEYVDPQVAALRQQLEEVQSKLSQNDRQAMEAKRQEITRHVTAFAADPKNVYFEELANDIAHLLKTGAEPTVEKAYEAAMWRNPAVRAKELARQQAEREAKTRKESEERVANAKKATSANVRTQARAGSATAPLGTMDETLASALAEIKGRS